MSQTQTNSDGSSDTITYGADGQTTILENSSSNGPSKIVSNNTATGQVTTTSYTGANGTGSVTNVSVENPDGSSTSTAFTNASPQASSGGTVSGGATVTLSDFGQSVTFAISSTSLVFAAVRADSDAHNEGYAALFRASGHAAYSWPHPGH